MAAGIASSISRTSLIRCFSRPPPYGISNWRIAFLFLAASRSTASFAKSLHLVGRIGPRRSAASDAASSPRADRRRARSATARRCARRRVRSPRDSRCRRTAPRSSGRNSSTGRRWPARGATSPPNLPRSIWRRHWPSTPPRAAGCGRSSKAAPPSRSPAGAIRRSRRPSAPLRGNFGQCQPPR